MDQPNINPSEKNTNREPVISPNLTNLPNGSNSFLKILLFILLAIVLVTGGILAGKYLFSLQAPNSQPVVTIPTLIPTAIPTTDPTVNWKTYINPALGFELKYPPSITIDKEFNDQYNRAAIFKGSDLNFEVMLRSNSGVTLDKYYYMDSAVKRKTTLDGMTANVYELPNGYCDGPNCSKPSIAIVTEKNSNLYHFIFYGDTQLSEIENQILSTFKFTQ